MTRHRHHVTLSPAPWLGPPRLSVPLLTLPVVVWLLLGGSSCGDDDGAGNNGSNLNNNNQTQAQCGNGVKEGAEECDNGSANSDSLPDACRSDCQLAHCGDGVVDSLEACDVGELNSDTEPDTCRVTCTLPRCGDDVVDTLAGEICDDGNNLAGDGCGPTCQLEACGNGYLDAGEECDDGAQNSNTLPDACRSDCRNPWCGDSVVDAGEECDIGSGNSDVLPDRCRLDCRSPFCGDGVVDSGEACDGSDLQDATCDSLGFPGGGVPVCPSCTSADPTPCCQDQDEDGFGEHCDLGPDCDDQAPGVTGACQSNGCPVGWAFIPAGDFEMGCNSGELGGSCRTAEQPRHTVTLSAYCMELTEVSVAAYRACKQTGACTGTPETCNWSTTAGNIEEHPINCIDWSDSREYCQAWMGGDLPTEAQWEKAARGGPGDTRKYPWGSTPEPDCTRANYENNDGQHICSPTSPPYTWPVGYLTTTLGDSPFGLKDMAGNVNEWVLDYYSPTFYGSCTTGCLDPLNTDISTYGHVYRGGSFAQQRGWQRVVMRYHNDFSSTLLGFRCRRTP
ncbi:MAG: SUMF1/EgtB/PvdO family nonheme iron enzyme [Polyangia bacterium]|nr:SUMF1/EgtB/PvdO family nonheme iron enzyme [Polyangia bacterium]